MDSPHTVYLLEHVHTQQDGEEDVKTIGIYSSRERAEEAIERLKVQPGFRDALEGFSINPYPVDEDNWAEGFLTISHDGSAAGEQDSKGTL